MMRHEPTKSISRTLPEARQRLRGSWRHNWLHNCKDGVEAPNPRLIDHSTGEMVAVRCTGSPHARLAPAVRRGSALRSSALLEGSAQLLSVQPATAFGENRLQGHSLMKIPCAPLSKKKIDYFFDKKDITATKLGATAEPR